LRGLAVLIAFMIGSTSLAAAVNQGKPGEGKKTRPNILLIISDDVGFDATTGMYPGFIDELVKQYGPSGHNHRDYKMINGRPASTPSLNSLSKAGMRFTQTWVNTFCSPTRTSMLTGLYSVKTGVLDYLGYLSQTHHSFVRDLKEKGGYSTAIFGKWHIAGLGQYPGMKPKEAGFDLFRGNLHGGVQTYHDWDYHIQDSTDAPDKYRTEKAPVRSLPGIAPTTFAPVVKTADAVNWITEQEKTNPDKPWFVWFAFNLSHITGQQQPNPMVIPNADTMDEISRKEMEACMGPDGKFGSANVGSCSSEALMRPMTNSMDTMAGILIDTVDKLDKNTYIIYIGDTAPGCLAKSASSSTTCTSPGGGAAKARRMKAAFGLGWRSADRASRPARRATNGSTEWICSPPFWNWRALRRPKPFPTGRGKARKPSTRFLLRRFFSRAPKICSIPIKAICWRKP
jgi:arylsulfatase A-like enzyme